MRLLYATKTPFDRKQCPSNRKRCAHLSVDITISAQSLLLLSDTLIFASAWIPESSLLYSRCVLMIMTHPVAASKIHNIRSRCYIPYHMQYEYISAKYLNRARRHVRIRCDPHAYVFNIIDGFTSCAALQAYVYTHNST